MAGAPQPTAWAFSSRQAAAPPSSRRVVLAPSSSRENASPSTPQRSLSQRRVELMNDTVSLSSSLSQQTIPRGESPASRQATPQDIQFSNSVSVARTYEQAVPLSAKVRSVSSSQSLVASREIPSFPIFPPAAVRTSSEQRAPAVMRQRSVEELPRSVPVRQQSHAEASSSRPQRQYSFNSLRSRHALEASSSGAEPQMVWSSRQAATPMSRERPLVEIQTVSSQAAMSMSLAETLGGPTQTSASQVIRQRSVVEAPGGTTQAAPSQIMRQGSSIEALGGQTPSQVFRQKSFESSGRPTPIVGNRSVEAPVGQSCRLRQTSVEAPVGQSCRLRQTSVEAPSNQTPVVRQRSLVESQSMPSMEQFVMTASSRQGTTPVRQRPVVRTSSPVGLIQNHRRPASPSRYARSESVTAFRGPAIGMTVAPRSSPGLRSPVQVRPDSAPIVMGFPAMALQPPASSLSMAISLATARPSTPSSRPTTPLPARATNPQWPVVPPQLPINISSSFIAPSRPHAGSTATVAGSSITVMPATGSYTSTAPSVMSPTLAPSGSARGFPVLPELPSAQPRGFLPAIGATSIPSPAVSSPSALKRGQYASSDSEKQNASPYIKAERPVDVFVDLKTTYGNDSIGESNGAVESSVAGGPLRSNLGDLDTDVNYADSHTSIAPASSPADSCRNTVDLTSVGVFASPADSLREVSDLKLSADPADFAGLYADVSFPGCPRTIAFVSATTVSITGHDGDPRSSWRGSGVVKGNVIVVNLSEKGGPENLEGKWTGSGICWVKENGLPLANDRNDSWYKDDALNFAGTYADVNYPGCPRIIQFSSASEVRVFGHDGDLAKPWKCSGVAKGSTITLDLSGKGGPPELEGKWTGAGIVWVKDGGVPIDGFHGWYKDDAMNFGGIYSDAKRPGCPRTVTFVSATDLTVVGHDGDPSQTWKCSGVAKGSTIIINLSNKGGPASLVGKWTGSGICWVKEDQVPIKGDGGDSWQKDEAMHFWGTYEDKSFPGCPRTIRFVSAANVEITGHDGSPAQVWTCSGVAEGSMIRADLSNKGGPCSLQGEWTGCGIRWLKKDGVALQNNDITAWVKSSTVCFAGIYADSDSPGCPRVLAFVSAKELLITGHDGDPAQSWECHGSVDGDIITVDLSPAKGPVNLEGVWTGTGIRWTKDGGIAIKAGSTRDNWYKDDTMNFVGTYFDAKRPNCLYSVTFTFAADVLVTGHDGDPANSWQATGGVKGNVITVSSSKGGPANLEGEWTGTGIRWTSEGGKPLENTGDSWCKCDSTFFVGLYADTLHPGCPRSIALVSATELAITGHDGNPAKPWSCSGVVRGRKIIANLANKGGPSELEGEWTGTGICWLKEGGACLNSDGSNNWLKNDAVNFSGTFADRAKPGCPRFITFTSTTDLKVTGHDGDPMKIWSCVGTAEGRTIKVNLSSNGGPAELEGIWTGSGIRWVKSDKVELKSDGSDDWYKDDTVNFSGVYNDRKLPGCPRMITFSSANDLTITGHDGDISRSWTCTGVAKGATILVDLSNQGGSASLEGQWTGTGICWIKDGGVPIPQESGLADSWYKDDSMIEKWRSAVTAVTIDFSGTYADVSRPGCPRTIKCTSATELIIIGHDGDPTKSWQCSGIATGETIRVDFSSTGGPASLEGRWTGTGIHWLRNGADGRNGDSSDDWTKSVAVNFAGAYAEVDRVGCPRIITFTSATDIVITGHDGDPACLFKCTGVCKDNTIIVDMSSKGGPAKLEGVWTGSGINWVRNGSTPIDNAGRDNWYKDEAMNFTGTFADPKQPGCPRIITFVSAAELLITGHDGDPSKPWICKGVAKGSTITVNLSSKGGPANLEGEWTGSGIRWISNDDNPIASDGSNCWFKDNSLNFAGIYGDINRPGCPRVITFISANEILITGHDGDPRQMWKCRGTVTDTTIGVNLNSPTGPPNLEGVWTGSGIRWVRNDGQPLKNDGKDNWYKNDAYNFAGTYAEANYPGCPRIITFISATELKITGHDGDPRQPWNCKGVAKGSTIVVNLSNKGGPSSLEGRWTGSGISWEKDGNAPIKNDGSNSWYKNDALNFAGTYSDSSYPGCPRIITFVSQTELMITGHDGDPSQPWKCRGVAKGSTIIVNLSSKGGPANLEGKWTGTGICWTAEASTPIESNGADNWRKENDEWSGFTSM